MIQLASHYRQLLQQKEQAQELIDSADQDMKDWPKSELEELGPQIEKVEKDLKLMLVPKDPRRQ